jgi:hypothetical protein
MTRKAMLLPVLALVLAAALAGQAAAGLIGTASYRSGNPK